MPIIKNTELQDIEKFSFDSRRQIYNAMDCCLTFEVFNALSEQNSNSNIIYNFERALQAPVFEMMQRGFRIDEYERQQGIKILEAQFLKLTNHLNEMALSFCGRAVSATSTPQLIKFLYGDLRLPKQWKTDKNGRRLSVDRESLEKLENYFHALPIISTILAIRDTVKKLSVLRTEISSDHRMPTSYNIAGTETGRWSSSSDAFGQGTNLQNITALLRKMFISDRGMKLCGIDLEQAESREVGWQQGILFNDWTYLDACYSGDLHTLTCKLIWDNLPWTGNPKEDRAIAEQIFYREYSYRDMSKRGGHGSNYYGKPFTMARHLKVPVSLMERFQSRYFSAFPGIPKWHRHVAEQLQQNQCLTTPFGRQRHFFGRQNDDATLREAIAFVPQSSTAERMNLGLYRVWKRLGSRIELLAQVHDAIYFQFPEHLDEEEIISEALQAIDFRLKHNDHELIVPGEAKTGWNWGNYDPKLNPDGLKKFKIKDERTRQRNI